MKKAHNFIDLTGQKFNRWTLVEYLGNGKYLGRCECGTEKVVRGVDIKRGKSKSCGCLKKESSTKTIQKQNEKQKGENHPYGTLHSHHLDSYNSHEERRLDITNGVCLCEHCHRDFHHYYGYGENTEEDYLEYKFAYQNN